MLTLENISPNDLFEIVKNRDSAGNRNLKIGKISVIVDCFTTCEQFFVMRDSGVPVAFAAVIPPTGSMPVPYVHYLGSLSSGKGYGVKLLELLEKEFDGCFFMQCEPLGCGDICDPYTPNYGLLDRFYRRDAKDILEEYIVEHSIWDSIDASFFYPRRMSDNVKDAVRTYLDCHYGNGKRGFDAMRSEIEKIVSKYVGKSTDNETISEIGNDIIELIKEKELG